MGIWDCSSVQGLLSALLKASCVGTGECQELGFKLVGLRHDLPRGATPLPRDCKLISKKTGCEIWTQTAISLHKCLIVPDLFGKLLLILGSSSGRGQSLSVPQRDFPRFLDGD